MGYLTHSVIALSILREMNYANTLHNHSNI